MAIYCSHRPFCVTLDRWTCPLIASNSLGKLGAAGPWEALIKHFTELLTGVANAINGPKYPKGSCQHPV